MIRNLESIGNYQIIKEIGAGGFGTVYLAQYKDIQYALKQLTKKIVAQDIPERFIRESLRVEELRKKHDLNYLVRIYEVLPEVNAFVMEYIPEASMDYMKRTGDDNFIVSLMRAVHQLHGMGVVHRDIKPENLRCRDSAPVLIDFGIASWWDSHSNIVPVGTRYYSPPEMMTIFPGYHNLNAAGQAYRQLAGINSGDARERIKSIKKLHDTYSLGITAGELLTGRLPFGGDSYRSYLEKGSEPNFTNWLNEIPQRFRDLIKEATAFYPVNRPSISHLVKDLSIDILPVIPGELGDEMESCFPEDDYQCVDCFKQASAPANFCPYCGSDLSWLNLEIDPIQPFNAANLPENVTILKNTGKIIISIDLRGDNFEITLGRKPGKAHIAFPDDNCMSGIHGKLEKEDKKVYYSDGDQGKLPTNPGAFNNIPIGNCRQELPAGSFLLLGNTVFKIKKYFGEFHHSNERSN